MKHVSEKLEDRDVALKKENDYIKSLAKSKTTKGYREALNEYASDIIGQLSEVKVIDFDSRIAVFELFVVVYYFLTCY